MSEFQSLGALIAGMTGQPAPTAPSSGMPLPSSGSRPPLTAESVRTCLACGAAVGTFAFQFLGGTRYMWRICPCQEPKPLTLEEIAEAEAARRQATIARLIGDAGLGRLQHLTIETFQPARLRSASPATHPFTEAVTWFNAALTYGSHADYRDPASPPAALYFYAAGKGRGKTHLAAGLALAACEQLKSVAYLQEHSYLDHRWSCPIEALEEQAAIPGERAWLTVLDDIGQRQKTGDSVRDAWYAVINRRYERRGWTIITSNRTLDELAEQGTINDATYSRLGQMMRGRLLFFDGDDLRWEPLT